MKQRTSFILKGLVSLVLSLVMLCGTAVTSLSAVTVDLAETGFNQITESNFGTPLYAFAQTPAMSAGWVTSPTSTSRVEMTAYDAGNNKKFYAAPVEFAQTINPNTISSAMLSFNLSFNNTNGNGGNFQYKGSSDSITVSSEEFEKLSDFKYQYSQTQRQGMFTGNVQVVWKNGENPQGSRMYLVYIPAFSAYNTSGHDYLFLTDTLSKLAITVNVKQMLEQADGSFVETTEAANIPTKTYSNLSIGGTISLSQTPSSEEYEFLGWYIKNSQISVSSPYTYTVADADKDSVDDQDEDFFTKRNSITVEARYRKKASEPVYGKYIFKYQDRYGTWKQKTVEVNLSADEIKGYAGNGNTPKVPTYLWSTPGDGGYATNPLVTASLTVTGHEGVEGETEQDDVSAYKKDIVWDFDDSTKRTVDVANSTVTIEATTIPVTFTFKYVIDNGTVTEGATKVPYGKVVTFNPLYQNSNYCYIEKDIPSKDFSYWSSDPEGNNILTTNRTFGMLLRGGSAVWDNVDKVLVVTAYAQYGKDVPENKWLPEIEEATLTRTIADGEDLTYADYMTNYFNYDGIAVQDMLKDSQYNGKIKYGILVVKSKSDLTTTKLTKDQMKNALNSMHALDGTEDAYTPYCASAALNSSRTRIAYRYEYDDAAHISNFNRTLYTLYGNEAKMNGYTFTAMAYITFDGGENYECSEVNTELVVDNTPSSNQ